MFYNIDHWLVYRPTFLSAFTFFHFASKLCRRATKIRARESEGRVCIFLRLTSHSCLEIRAGIRTRDGRQGHRRQRPPPQARLRPAKGRGAAPSFQRGGHQPGWGPTSRG